MKSAAHGGRADIWNSRFLGLFSYLHNVLLGAESRVGEGRRRLQQSELWAVVPVPLVPPCGDWKLHSSQGWAEPQRGN